MKQAPINFFVPPLFSERDNDTSMWRKEIPEMSDQKPIFKGFLSKLSSTGKDQGRFAERYFELYNTHLVYKKGQSSSKYSAAVNLEFVYVSDQVADDSLIQKDMYSIQISYLNKFSLLYTRNEEERNLWLFHLSRVCLRSDIHKKFIFEKLIGTGSFAKVYEATKGEDRKKCAIKVMSKEEISQVANGKEAVWNEIVILRLLNHENLLKVVETHETKNSIYLVSDLYDGGDLQSLIESKYDYIDYNECLSILEGILRGLSQLSSLNIVHRDLKPTNIMLRKRTDIQPEDVVIVDFGLSAEAHRKDMVYKRCGTPGFVAPEILRVEEGDNTFELDPKSDVFCAGLIFYLLITGVNPLQNPKDSVNQVLMKNYECKIRFNHPKLKSIPKDALILLKMMMSTSLNERISAKDALESSVFKGWKSENGQENSSCDSIDDQCNKTLGKSQPKMASDLITFQSCGEVDAKEEVKERNRSLERFKDGYTQKRFEGVIISETLDAFESPSNHSTSFHNFNHKLRTGENEYLTSQDLAFRGKRENFKNKDQLKWMMEFCRISPGN